MIKTAGDVKDVLARVRFAPSCVDMGWEWEVVNASWTWDEAECVDQWTSLTTGYLIRTTFRRPDRDTGKIATGYGRWWHVPHDVTESGIVKTAFAAAKLILEHELMEAFRVDGDRVFDPHHDLEDLRAACRAKAGQ
jgi:hypothetical protein